MSKYAEGIDWDITFCSNKECNNKDCDKHLKSENAKSYPPYRPMYVADFKDKCKECDNNGWNIRGTIRS